MPSFFGADDIVGNRQRDTEGMEPVILAGVWKTSGGEYRSEEEFLYSMEELAELAKACGMEPAGMVMQRLYRPDQALYVGSGKVAEIERKVQANDAGRVIFNDTLSPSQIRNLQKILRVPVADRTRLILEIFETRARTREAKLQVELAKLSYLKPRLIGYWETQNRQGGTSGSMSSKGEGEKQLEIDRRTIDHRLSELRRELQTVGRERQTQRKKRSASHLPIVALVGYTNAGKSTVLNAMLERWSPETNTGDKKVFEADMLFATLDTSVRKIHAAQGREFLLSDTVGFIHALPAALVEAFHSTLEEVTEADLLLHVVDGSDEHCFEQMQVTRETIAELGAAHIPTITVFNKSDLRDPPIDYPRRGFRQISGGSEMNENVYICAKEGSSIEFLTEIIFEKLESRNVYREFLVPYQKGAVQAFLTEHARIIGLDYREDGVHMELSCTPAVAEKARKMLGASDREIEKS